MTQTQVQPSTDRRPVPQPDDVTRFYWDAASAHRLVLQRCRPCGKLQYPPEVCCIHCQADDFEHVDVAGRGVIYSYSVVNRPLHAGFADSLPYVVALVELDDQPGLRMLTNIVELASGTQLECGMPVEVVFEDRRATTLPQFRLSENAV